MGCSPPCFFKLQELKLNSLSKDIQFLFEITLISSPINIFETKKSNESFAISKYILSLVTKVTVLIPNHIQLNDLYYEIEFDPKFTGAALFIDVLDGKEKFISLIFDNTGIIHAPLNPSNYFKTENFEVEKLIFNCYRKIEFNFSLKKSEISKGSILQV